MPDSTFKYSYKETLRENTGLAVYNSGYQNCTPGYGWGPAMRDHYLIHYVASGTGTYRCGEQEFILGAGDLFLVRPETIVSYTASINTPWVYYWVGFHGADARRLIAMTSFSSDKLVLHRKDRAAGISALLVDIYESRGGSPADDAAMTGRLYLFLSRLIADGIRNSPRTAQSSEYFEAAVKFIGANFGQEITVADIAGHVALSRSQLYRVFMRECGLSPVAFLGNYKINEACTLLRTHNLTIAQAAQSVGIADPLYFSRMFKKIKGVTPTQYKNKHFPIGYNE